MHVSAFWMWQSGWPIQTVLRNLPLRPTLNIYCCSELLWSTWWFSSQLRGEVLQYLEVTHLQRSQVSFFFFPPVRFTTADASLWHSGLNANPELSTAPKKMKSILTFFAETDALLSTKLDEHLGGGEFLAGDHHCLWCQPCRNWRQQNMEGGMHTLLLENDFFLHIF